MGVSLDFSKMLFTREGWKLDEKICDMLALEQIYSGRQGISNLTASPSMVLLATGLWIMVMFSRLSTTQRGDLNGRQNLLLQYAGRN